jgi:ComF family protein
LIKQLKFERAAAAARSIAQVMAQQFTRRGDDLVVTHVPTATSRQRVRGYDQAALIAREFASLTHLPYMPLLARQGHLRQLGQSRKQRIQQMQQAFRPLKYSRMTQKRVLLIDDVLTTGSSIESAALTLSKSGVQHISAFVFAVADFSWINGQ